MSTLRAAIALSVAAASALAAADPGEPSRAQAPSEKSVVFLAGPKDHGLPGRHEYERDLRVLAHGIETATNLPKIKTKLIVGRAPRDLNEIADAAVIVIHSSSDRHEKETHPLFPPEPSTNRRGYDPETTAYLKAFDALIKRGTGVVIFHYANWVENWAARGHYLDWTGGLWVQMASRNPNDQWSMKVLNDGHPIHRGVSSWDFRDEVFCRFFLPDDPRRTDLIQGTPAKSPVGPQIVSWAYQRDDGGRGFVMGAVDFHDNMQIETYRRFLLNGIVWAGGWEVPAEGVQSTLPLNW